MNETEFSVRDAVAADATFLELMLLEAVNWSSERQMALGELRATPELDHYIIDWPQLDDLGLVATDDNGNPIGAVWLRAHPAHDPGFGYVASDVPELGIGVRAEWRGRGVGRRLLHEQVEQARSRGITRISLSVERANPAIELYRSEGWESVVSGPHADTMILDIPPDSEQEVVHEDARR